MHTFCEHVPQFFTSLIWYRSKHAVLLKHKFPLQITTSNYLNFFYFYIWPSRAATGVTRLNQGTALELPVKNKQRNHGKRRLEEAHCQHRELNREPRASHRTSTHFHIPNRLRSIIFITRTYYHTKTSCHALFSFVTYLTDWLIDRSTHNHKHSQSVLCPLLE